MKAVLSVTLVLVVLLSLVGCKRTNTVRKPTPEEIAIVKRYDSLPDSTKAALSAKDMIGFKVAIAPKVRVDTPGISYTLQEMLEQGAERSSIKDANLVLNSVKQNPFVWVTCQDKFGNTMRVTKHGALVTNLNENSFRSEVRKFCVSLGTERKIAALNEGNKRFIETHKRILKIK